MSKKIEILIPTGPSGNNELALTYRTEVFNSVSSTEYLRKPNKDFNKKCYEINSAVKKLFNVPLGPFDVKKIKPLALKKLEKGLKKYLFGEFGIVTMQDKDLKRMYYLKRLINRQKKRNQSFHIDAKNGNIIINRRFMSNKRIKVPNTSIGNCISQKELLSNKKITMNKKTGNNTNINSNSKFGLFPTSLKLTSKQKFNNNTLANSNGNTTQTNGTLIQLIKGNHSISKYKGIKGRNIKLNNNYFDYLSRNDNKNSYDALSVDNIIRSNDNIKNVNNKNTKLTTSHDTLTSSKMYQTQKVNCLNTTYSSGFGIQTQNNHCNSNSSHQIQISLSEASNRLIPKMPQMTWAKYTNYPLVHMKTQDDKEKEKDLESLLDIKVDFNNKKEICKEFNRRMNNEDYLNFRRAVVKFANEIGNINPTTSLKLNDVIKEDYFKQTRTSKYTKIAETQTSHNNIMNKLRFKMSKHYFHLSKLMSNYSRIKNKIFVS